MGSVWLVVVEEEEEVKDVSKELDMALVVDKRSM